MLRQGVDQQTDFIILKQDAVELMLVLDADLIVEMGALILVVDVVITAQDVDHQIVEVFVIIVIVVFCQMVACTQKIVNNRFHVF